VCSAVSAAAFRALFNKFESSTVRSSRSASLPRVTRSAFVRPSDCVGSHEQMQRIQGRFTLIWFLVLLIAILAIAGGIALSKFLFILLVVAVIVALLGARSTA
jgi:hypothetical protein